MESFSYIRCYDANKKSGHSVLFVLPFGPNPGTVPADKMSVKTWTLITPGFCAGLYRLFSEPPDCWIVLDTNKISDLSANDYPPEWPTPSNADDASFTGTSAHVIFPFTDSYRTIQIKHGAINLCMLDKPQIPVKEIQDSPFKEAFDIVLVSTDQDSVVFQIRNMLRPRYLVAVPAKSCPLQKEAGQNVLRPISVPFVYSFGKTSGNKLSLKY